LKKYYLQVSYNNFKIKFIVSFCESGPWPPMNSSLRRIGNQLNLKCFVVRALNQFHRVHLFTLTWWLYHTQRTTPTPPQKKPLFFFILFPTFGIFLNNILLFSVKLNLTTWLHIFKGQSTPAFLLSPCWQRLNFISTDVSMSKLQSVCVAQFSASQNVVFRELFMYWTQDLEALGVSVCLNVVRKWLQVA